MDVRKVVLNVVEQCAPEEIIIAESFQNGKQAKAASGPLGFGGAFEAALLTPIIWKIVEEVADKFLKPLSEEVLKDLAHYAAQRFAKSLDSMSDTERKKQQSLDAATEQVYKILDEAQVEGAKARVLAETVVRECLKERAHV